MPYSFFGGRVNFMSEEFSAKLFCPKCGESNTHLFFGFCLDCLLKDEKLFSIPEKVSVGLCVKCDRVKHKNRFVDFSNEVLLAAIRAETRFKKIDSPTLLFLGSEEIQKGVLFSVLVEGLLDDKKISIEEQVEVLFDRMTCPDCSRVAGSYYEAILQARFEPKTPKDVIEKKMREVEAFLELNSKKDKLSKVVKKGMLANGFDLQVGSLKSVKKAAKHFAPQLKAPIKVSFKLHGWDLTKNLPTKRFSFALRF